MNENKKEEDKEEEVKAPETLEIRVSDSVSQKDLGPGQKK